MQARCYNLLFRIQHSATDATRVVVNPDNIPLGAKTTCLLGWIAGFWITTLRPGAVHVKRG
jgi:hypothetical protein